MSGMFFRFSVYFNTIRSICFPKVVQRHTLGEVGNGMDIWKQVVSGIFVPKIIIMW